MAEDTATTKTLPIKTDWYQTDTAVVITVLIKNVPDTGLQVHFSEGMVQVNITIPQFEPTETCFHLAHKILPEQSSYKLTPSKIEIKLKKLEGIRWEKLEGDHEIQAPKPIPVCVGQSEGPPAYPTSKKGKDWSAIEKDMKKQEAEEKPEGEEALNKLFQEIYGKGSDEVKKAMNKSYMESGGTVLSTNWNEISQQKVEVKPPDGMEFKKWND